MRGWRGSSSKTAPPEPQAPAGFGAPVPLPRRAAPLRADDARLRAGLRAAVPVAALRAAAGFEAFARAEVAFLAAEARFAGAFFEREPVERFTCRIALRMQPATRGQGRQYPCHGHPGHGRQELRACDGFIHRDLPAAEARQSGGLEHRQRHARDIFLAQVEGSDEAVVEQGQQRGGKERLALVLAAASRNDRHGCGNAPLRNQLTSRDPRRRRPEFHSLLRHRRAPGQRSPRNHRS